jgi:hypothetical protein
VFKGKYDGDWAVGEIQVKNSFQWPREIEPGTYRGLLGCVVSETSGSRAVTSYWRDQSARELRIDSLAEALGGVVTKRSLVSEIRRPKKRFGWDGGDAVLKVGALVGAATVIMTLFSTLFAWPSYTINLLDRAPIPSAIGDSAIFSIALVNNSRLTALDVNLAPGDSAIRLSGLKISVAGGTQTLVSGTAYGLRLGESDDSIIATGRSGSWMWSSRRVLPVKIMVWKPLMIQPFRLRSESWKPRLATIEGILGVASALGTKVACEATIPRAPAGVSFLAVATPKTLAVSRDSTRAGDARTITLNWQFETKHRFAPVPTQLVISSTSPLDSISWTRLTDAVEWACQEGA